MEREEWRPFLRRWSAEWIDSRDSERDGPPDEELARSRWLGFAPATEASIADAESRLGRRLPPSLREFLLVTDGWQHPTLFIERLASTDELGWIRDVEPRWLTYFSGDIPDAAILRRALQISVGGEARVMFLDPDDVDTEGEWAGYLLDAKSGLGLQHRDCFYELIHREYAMFHRLRRPAGETRDRWAAEAERARLAVLAGELDGPLRTLETARDFGAERADLLLFQLWMLLGRQGDAYRAIQSFIVNTGSSWTRDEPVIAREVIPLLLREFEDRTGWGSQGLVEHIMAWGMKAAHQMIIEERARADDPDHHPWFGDGEFGAAALRARRVAIQVLEEAEDGAREARREAALASTGPEANRIIGAHRQAVERALDDAWAELEPALGAWRPLNRDHLAPLGLLADPALRRVVTPARARQFLTTRHGEHGYADPGDPPPPPDRPAPPDEIDRKAAEAVKAIGTVVETGSLPIPIPEGSAPGQGFITHRATGTHIDLDLDTKIFASADEIFDVLRGLDAWLGQDGGQTTATEFFAPLGDGLPAAWGRLLEVAPGPATGRLLCTLSWGHRADGEPSGRQVPAEPGTVDITVRRAGERYTHVAVVHNGLPSELGEHVADLWRYYLRRLGRLATRRPTAPHPWVEG